MHRATVLLLLSTVVPAGGGAVGGKAKITASVPRASWCPLANLSQRYAHVGT